MWVLISHSLVRAKYSLFVLFHYLCFYKMSRKSFSNDNRLPKRITRAANILQAVKEKKESLNNLIYSEDNAHVVRYFKHVSLTHFLPVILLLFFRISSTSMLWSTKLFSMEKSWTKCLKSWQTKQRTRIIKSTSTSQKSCSLSIFGESKTFHLSPTTTTLMRSKKTLIFCRRSHL